MSTSTPIDTAALNAAFQALSPAEKRRAIARDVLERLEAKRLIASPGNWVVLISASEETDLQTVLHDPSEQPCYACALGSAACGIAHFEDNLKLRSPSLRRRELDVTDFRARLVELFGLRQIGMIELCFEGSSAAFLCRMGLRESDVMSDDDHQACCAFRWDVSSSDAMLRAIWADVAADPEGLFDPKRALATINAAAS